MRCFSVCFGIPKNRKAPKAVLNSSFPRHQRDVKWGPLQPTKPVEVSNSVISDPPTLESKDKYDDQLNYPRLKVSIDSDVKSYNEASIQEVWEFPVGNDKMEKEIEREMKENTGNQDIANCTDKIWEKEKMKIQIQSFSDSSNSSSMISYPPMDKYNNCSSSENESEAMKLQKMEENGDLFYQEESSESLFSLSIESRKQENGAEMDDKEVNSAITIGLNQNVGYQNRTSFVDSVLNPVENITPWKKDVKATTIGATLEISDDEKENVNLGQGVNIIIPFSEEPSFKRLNPNSKQHEANHLKAEDSEFAVDTSLSSWLVESGKLPMIKESPNSIAWSSNSSSKFEDKPILGALTIDEIKEHSVSSTPKRSSSRYSPDEMPIIGTVGSYWSHTGHKIDSSESGSSRSRMSTKFREDKKRVNCHSAPFVKRLESTLDRGIA